MTAASAAPPEEVNHEEQLQQLAQAESDALVALQKAVASYDASMQRIEASFLETIGPLVQVEAEAHAALHNAIVDAPTKLWAKRKTRVVGLCKYGWRKRRGKLVVANQEDAIERLIRALGDNGAERYIILSRSLKKKELAELSASVLKKIGAILEQDTDEPVVESTASGLAKRVEKLRDSSLTDIPGQA